MLVAYSGGLGLETKMAIHFSPRPCRVYANEARVRESEGRREYSKEDHEHEFLSLQTKWPLSPLPCA